MACAGAISVTNRIDRSLFGNATCWSAGMADEIAAPLHRSPMTQDSSGPVSTRSRQGVITGFAFDGLPVTDEGTLVTSQSSLAVGNCSVSTIGVVAYALDERGSRRISKGS